MDRRQRRAAADVSGSFNDRTLAAQQRVRSALKSVDPEYANLVDVFQYFAGNTDYSPVTGARGETCCHNTNLFGDAAGPVFAVPYDFDMSGLADAPYATPNPELEITSTRDRLYRGRCEHNDHLADSIAALEANKEALYALVENEPGMNSASSAAGGWMNMLRANRLCQALSLTTRTGRR